MRALVTGGAGFIGSHVVDALVERGDDVWVLDNLASGRRENVNAGSRLVEADVRDAGAVASAFAEARPETCFHLAAQADVRVSIAEPAFDAEVNVIGTANVLEAARANEAKVVFSSTGGAIYGECDGPADENSPRLPLAPYGTSKLAGEEYLGTWSRLYGAGHVALRFGNVYGPRQDPHGEAGVVAIFFGRVANGQELHVFFVEGFVISPFEAEFGRHVALFHPVDDFDAVRQRIAEAGGEIVEPLRSTPFKRIFFREPINGYLFELIDSERHRQLLAEQLS